MPGVTFYRLVGQETTLESFVDAGKAGLPGATRTVDGASVAFWRKPTQPDVPPWAKIVKDAFPNEDFEAPGSRDSVLLVVRTRIGRQYSVWALSFGNIARYWIADGRIDYQAPLIAAIELLREPTSGVLSGLTSIVATEVSREAQRITRVLPRGGSLPAFRFDAGAQAMRRAEGKAHSAQLRGSMAAGTSIHLTAIRSFNEAVEAIRVLERAYRAGRARPEPIPGLQPIDDSGLLAMLNNALLDQVRAADASVAVLLPVEYRGRPLAATMTHMPAGHGAEDFDVSALHDDLAREGRLARLTIDELADSVKLMDASDFAAIPVLNLFEYLHTAITRDHTTYILMERQWYGVPSTWLAEVGARVDGCLMVDGYLRYAHIDENAYNEELAIALGGVCLDRQLLRGPGFGRSGIEVSDVLALTQDRNSRRCLTFIAVKRGTLSQKVSHLLTQVETAVSVLAQPHLRTQFHRRVHPTLPAGALQDTFDELFGANMTWDPTRIQITLGIVGSWNGDPVSRRIPVLARVSMQQTIALASSLGHPVAIARIEEAATAPTGTR